MALLGPDFYDRPVHGPEGRVAAARRELGLRQVDFAPAVGVSRETVSHWENVRAEGTPRARVSWRHAAGIAALVQEQLGELATPEDFFAPRESPVDRVSAELEEVRNELRRLRGDDVKAMSPQAGHSANVPWEGSDDELLGVRAAAALLTVTPPTLYGWARGGHVPYIRLGPRALRWTRPLLRQIRDQAITQHR
jgi:DNA-binding XRE family transcriptional regulator/predicted DNA-binding transcriptional regulator AlpA